MIATTTIADAIRTVTAKVQKAIETGHRSRAIDADDLIEILLSIADELDREYAVACPECGSAERAPAETDGMTYCMNCGLEYLID